MKTKQLPLLLVLAAIIPVLSFKSINKAQDYRIAIGFGYVDMPCNGITVKTAKAYQYRTAKGGSFSAMNSDIKEKIASQLDISESDINVVTSTKQHGVIISYSKRISGYGCTKKMYTYGFGNDYEEAKQDAIYRKNLDDKNSDYGVIQTISVY